jgi:hypothetical protein
MIYVVSELLAKVLPLVLAVLGVCWMRSHDLAFRVDPFYTPDPNNEAD